MLIDDTGLHSCRSRKKAEGAETSVHIASVLLAYSLDGVALARVVHIVHLETVPAKPHAKPGQLCLVMAYDVWVALDLTMVPGVVKVKAIKADSHWYINGIDVIARHLSEPHLEQHALRFMGANR